jgi:hypothetical protein
MLHQSFILIVGALAGAVSAASFLDSLTPACTTALQGVLVAPDAACLNLGSFLSSALSSNKSVPDIANDWLTGLCATGSCSNSSIASVVQTVTTGCAEDLNNLGLGNAGISTQTILDYAQTFYPTVRQIACLKDDGANMLCVPETISSLQLVVGTLGVQDLQWDNLWADIQKLANSSDYKNIACTGCVKQAYTLAAQVFPFPDLLSEASQPITDACGASFTDGQDVDGVSETALASVFVAKAQSQSGAMNFRPRPVGLTFTMLGVAISATFFFLS